MSGKRALAQPRDVVYIYDGSFPGLLCCVHESVYQHEIPFDIFPETSAQPSLMPQKYIATDEEKARRVHDSIPVKISPEALELVRNVFFTCLKQKELCTLRFLLFGYQQGAKTTNMLGHPTVATMIDANKHLMGEAHLLTGFVRFEELPSRELPSRELPSRELPSRELPSRDFGNALVATITPNNFVLPFLTRHFVSRYNAENFMIYDKTHKAALLYTEGKAEIISIENLTLPEPSEKEKNYQELWKQFYRTIAIEARHNPRCRMTHMPKRYWENMTEVKEELGVRG